MGNSKSNLDSYADDLIAKAKKDYDKKRTESTIRIITEPYLHKGNVLAPEKRRLVCSLDLRHHHVAYENEIPNRPLPTSLQGSSGIHPKFYKHQYFAHFARDLGGGRLSYRYGYHGFSLTYPGLYGTAGLSYSSVHCDERQAYTHHTEEPYAKTNTTLNLNMSVFLKEEILSILQDLFSKHISFKDIHAFLTFDVPVDFTFQGQDLEKYQIGKFNSVRHGPHNVCQFNLHICYCLWNEPPVATDLTNDERLAIPISAYKMIGFSLFETDVNDR